MHSGLQLRSDYAHSPEGLSELTKLIRDVFGVDISPLNTLGHDPSVVAFGWWRGGELVANVSLYQRQLWLSGEQVRAYGVQSAAVRPELRGQGLFRDLMHRALDYADARVSLVTLATGTPNLYAPFGFRSVRESVFSGILPLEQRPSKSRRLSLTSKADVTLLLDLFARRVPTSLLAAACDHPALFMLKAVECPEIELIHLFDLDAVVAVKGHDQAPVTLLDVVAPSIPSLEDIAAALGYDGARIDVHLTPDRLGWAPEENVPVDTGCMVRGPYPPEGRPLMLSSMKV